MKVKHKVGRIPEKEKKPESMFVTKIPQMGLKQIEETQKALRLLKSEYGEIRCWESRLIRLVMQRD